MPFGECELNEINSWEINGRQGEKMTKQAVNMVLLHLWGRGSGVFRSVLIALHLIHRGRISKMMLKVADRAIRLSAFSWGIRSCLPGTVITSKAS